MAIEVKITKLDIIRSAYSQMRISGLTVDPTPEDIELGLQRLESMAWEFESRGVAVLYNFEEQPQPSSVSNIPPEFRQAFVTNLALRLLPDFNVQPNQILLTQANQSYSNMSARIQLTKVKETAYPNRQPRGSGNTLRYYPWNRFYRDGSSTSTSTGTSTGEYAIRNFDDLIDTPDSKAANSFVVTNTAGDLLTYLSPTLGAGGGISLSTPTLIDRPEISVNIGDGIGIVDGQIVVDGTVVRVDRLINTTDGLTGGGGLGEDLTLGIDSTIARSNINLIAGSGLSGGGDLTSDKTFNVNVDRGLTIFNDNVGIDAIANGGLDASAGAKVDINNTSRVTAVNGSDVVMFETSSGLVSITRDNLLSSVAGGTELRGATRPLSTDPQPITQLTIQGDPLNPTISQGTAPAFGGITPNGFNYLVLLDPSDRDTGVVVQMGGPTGSPESFTVFDQDSLQWIGDRWLHLETGDAVISVHGRQGTVVAENNDYTSSQIANVPSGQITSNNVQAALNELDVEKGSLALANSWLGVNTFTDTSVEFNKSGSQQDTLVWKSNDVVDWTLYHESDKRLNLTPTGDYEFQINSNKVWHAGNVGAGSGLNADLLDGLQSTSFVRADTSDTKTGDLTMTSGDLTMASGDLYFQGASSGDVIFQNNSGTQTGRLWNNASGTNISGSNSTSESGSAVLHLGDNSITFQGNKVWNADNDGSGSGLDADLLDGQEGSYYRDASNLNAGTVNSDRLPTTSQTVKGAAKMWLDGTTLRISTT